MSTKVQIILSRDVANLGRLGDVVKVAAGYARNFLFPKRFAWPISQGRLKGLEHQKRLVEHQRSKLVAQSEGVKKVLEGLQLTLTAKVGESGKLFGSIGTRDIEVSLADMGYVVDHKDIKLEGPIKTAGLHQIPLRLEADVHAMLNVVIVAEKEEEAPVLEEDSVDESADSDEDEISLENEDADASEVAKEEE